MLGSGGLLPMIPVHKRFLLRPKENTAVVDHTTPINTYELLTWIGVQVWMDWNTSPSLVHIAQVVQAIRRIKSFRRL